MKDLVKSPLHLEKIDIVSALRSVASQENCDGPEYDLMWQAADIIRKYRKDIERLEGVVEDLEGRIEGLKGGI